MSQYCTIADLTTYGFPQKAASTFLDVQKTAMIVSVSAEADGQLGRRYTLPLATYGADLTRAVAVISVYELTAARGFDSADLGSSMLRRAELARKWLQDVGDGKLDPGGVTDETPDVNEGGAAHLITSTRRGW